MIRATGIGPGCELAPSLRVVWAVFFTYAAMVAVLVQTVVLPHLVPAWHNGHGLMRGTDAPVFHRLAVKEADKIRREGWSSWHLRPGTDFPVGIASAVYSVSVEEPWTLIPINAAVHATAGVVLVRIVEEFVRRRWFACWAAIPCIAYPSALTWYAQLHRDGWAILGICLTVFGWLVLARSRTPGGAPGRGAGAAWILLGGALVWVVRPYLLQVFLVFGVAIALLLSGAWLMRGWGGRARWRDAALVSALSWLVVSALGWGAVKGLAAVPAGEGGTLERSEAESQPREFEWQRSRWLPASVDRRLGLIARDRAALLQAFQDAGSNVDVDVEFHRASAVLAYAPRALAVALFAPFPRDWLGSGVTLGGTLMRRVAGAEMLGVYLALAFVPYAVWRWRSRIETYILLLFGAGMPVVYAVVVANVGTLYRLRYGYLMLLVGLGVGTALVVWGDWRRAR